MFSAVLLSAIAMKCALWDNLSTKTSITVFLSFVFGMMSIAIYFNVLFGGGKGLRVPKFFRLLALDD